MQVQVSRLRRFVKFLWASSDQVSALAAVLALGGAVIGFLHARQEFRVRQSLDYVKRASEGATGEADAKLAAFWSSPKGKTILQGRTKGLQQRATVAVSENHLEPHVREMQAFYREVALCSAADTCDSATTCTFFFRDVMAFATMYGGYLRAWEEEWNENVGEEIRHFLEEECSQQWREYHQDRAADQAKTKQR